MRRLTTRRRSLVSFALLACAALPVQAADEGVIRAGVDLWATAGGELTFTSFKDDPIPAGFFCPGSAAFAGTVQLRGVPLATEPASSLGAIDTIVQRLDDAPFDADGIARTRIRLMALSLAATEPVATDCGRYDLTVALTGDQPLTEMKIYRTAKFGGTYRAPLALEVAARFTPAAGNANPPRTLTRRVELGPGTYSVWSYQAGPDREGPVRIDTDGDRLADTPLPPESNFLAGVSPAADGPRQGRIEFAQTGAQCPTPLCPHYTCHCTPQDEEPDWDENGDSCEDEHLHCTWVCVQFPDRVCASLPGLPL